MKIVYDSGIYKKVLQCIHKYCMFPNFFCHLFYILNTFMCLLPRFLTKEIERMGVRVLSSIVQCEFEGLEHFD